jgi:hypothetical protein
MDLLKNFVRLLVEILKYSNTIRNNFNSLKADLNEQIKKIVKICSFALVSVLLIFFTLIIFFLGLINILNDYFNSVYIGHFCVGGFLLILILFVNYFKSRIK